MLEKTLESPLDCREIQPVKEISPGCSLEGLMLKLKLQYFGHLMQRAFEKTLMLGKIEGRRRRGRLGWDGWMASPTQWTGVWVNSGSWWWTGRPGCAAAHGVAKSWTWLSIWTDCSFGSHIKTLGVVYHFLLQWTTFCQNFYYDLSVLADSAWHGSQLHCIM